MPVQVVVDGEVEGAPVHVLPLDGVLVHLVPLDLVGVNVLAGVVEDVDLLAEVAGAVIAVAAVSVKVVVVAVVGVFTAAAEALLFLLLGWGGGDRGRLGLRGGLDHDDLLLLPLPPRLLLPLFRTTRVDRADTVTQTAHEVVLVGGLGLHLVGVGVLVPAGEDVAARGDAGRLPGPHHLDAAGVAVVGDGGDVKEGQAHVAVEGDLAQHAGDPRFAIGDGPPVADPAVGEGLGDLLVGGDAEGLDFLVGDAGGEDDGAVLVVLVDEGDLGLGEGGDDPGQGQRHCAEEPHGGGWTDVVGGWVSEREEVRRPPWEEYFFCLDEN